MDQASPALRAWFEPPVLRRGIEGFLTADVERLTSDELAREFAHSCPVPGAEPDDFKNRWLEVAGLGATLAGIRFWSLDLERPFVTVVASERLPRTPGDLADAAHALSEAFAQFSPKHIRIFLPYDAPLAPTGPEQFWEKRVLAAPLHELRTRPTPSAYDRVQLKPAADTSSYPRYRQAFEDLLEDSPIHREYTRMETEEDLADLAKAGTLFDVFVDGHWAGLTAVDEGNEEGVEGYRMIEILLARHARGQRLGGALQRRLLEALPDPSKLLLGTIDVRNVAAIRTAERVGRIDVGGYLWAPL